MRGDQTLVEWNTKLDNHSDPILRVSTDEMQSVLTGLPDDQLAALIFSIERVRFFHERQSSSSWIDQILGVTQAGPVDNNPISSINAGMEGLDTQARSVEARIVIVDTAGPEQTPLRFTM